LEADTSRISTAKNPSMKKTIKLSKKTEIVLYDMATKKESSLKFSGLEVGDSLVIGTEESTYEKVNELDEFIAAKISATRGCKACEKITVVTMFELS